MLARETFSRAESFPPRRARNVDGFRGHLLSLFPPVSRGNGTLGCFFLRGQTQLRKLLQGQKARFQAGIVAFHEQGALEQGLGLAQLAVRDGPGGLPSVEPSPRGLAELVQRLQRRVLPWAGASSATGRGELEVVLGARSRLPQHPIGLAAAAVDAHERLAQRLSLATVLVRMKSFREQVEGPLHLVCVRALLEAQHLVVIEAIEDVEPRAHRGLELARHRSPIPIRRSFAFAMAPVPWWRADTASRPLSSRENVTSIRTVPRGAGSIPVSSTSPRIVLSPKRGASPWLTRTRTTCCWSRAVVKVRVRSHGIGLLRAISVST